ncbi:MAG TPA: DUF6519 domain-containing protein [Kineosporiaceae bacterium]
MHGDFSNVTFRSHKQFTGVFELQGRVGLDAPHNELQAILQHHLRQAVMDLVGPAAGPADSTGFRIDLGEPGDLTIGAGRYYVGGLAVTNPEPTTYLDQPVLGRWYPSDQRPQLPPRPYLVYLHVWERHVTELEDPSLHEPALGLNHPDSSSRAQVWWRVGAVHVPPEMAEADRDAWIGHWLDEARRPGGQLQVRARRPEDADTDPCTAPPDAAYVGENQLYRVEILRGTGAEGGPAFVWSRDNGSFTYGILDADGATLTLRSLGRDRYAAVHEGDWVEVVDDAVSRRPTLSALGDGRVLSRITGLDRHRNRVTLDPPPPFDVASRLDLHPYLRRWDLPAVPDDEVPPEARFGVPVLEADPGGTSGWIPLERGIEIRFLRADTAAGAPEHRYRADDYWNFTARRILADVVYDNPGGAPSGVDRWFAPLAVVAADGAFTRMRQLFTRSTTRES